MKAVRCILKGTQNRWVDFPLTNGGTLGIFMTQARFEGYAVSTKGNLWVAYDQIACAFEIEGQENEPVMDFTKARAMQ